MILLAMNENWLRTVLLKPLSLSRGVPVALTISFCLLAITRTGRAGPAMNQRAGASQSIAAVYERGRLELGLESIYTFVTIPNPFFGTAGLYNKSPIDYELSTQILALALSINKSIRAVVSSWELGNKRNSDG